MKRMLSLLVIILIITGCSENKVDNKKIVNTLITAKEKNTYTKLQNEIIKIEQTPEEIDEVPSTILKNNYLIVIDAGHQARGNSELEPIGPGANESKPKVTSGATGVSSGKLESEINLEVAFKLEAKLKAEGYQVKMVRTSQDVDMSNRQRAQIANDSNASIFIRLHCNSADSSSATGTLTMAPSVNNPYCSNIANASYRLSKEVVDNICMQTGSVNRGVMISDTMSGINWCSVPVTIVEMGFLSNPQEDQQLCDDGYQNKIVDGIVMGINKYLE